METKGKVAIIIGAGPGGLTAAYELLTRTNIKPLIFEKTNDIGGLSKTVNYKGNRIDIGGHRFFSKSDRVMKWWQIFLPIQSQVTGTSAEKGDLVMLIRHRRSSIFYLRKFFDYPISLNFRTIQNLGFNRIIKIGWAYFLIKLFPIKKESNLEEFFINRFGKELYLTFFKDYTEKVWGIPCHEIKPEWGSQRIKGLSIGKAVFHAVSTLFQKESTLEQKNTETSLIDKFLYPKHGPGQLWEEVRNVIIQKGGQVIENNEVLKINWINPNRVQVTALNHETQEKTTHQADYLFSTMPIKELINSMGNDVPQHVKRIAEGLKYRDFMTVGLLVKHLKVGSSIGQKNAHNPIVDNWIYIQEQDVRIGRLQIFNNWSPYLVADPNQVWLGLEYFCEQGDHLWNMEDPEFIRFAIEELVKIGIIDLKDVLDATRIRVPKAYPAYFGTFNEMDQIVNFTSCFKNLFLIGRNGMHKYNNQDHSMLTAMVSVDNIIAGHSSKENIWAVNTEKDYHENADKK